jgi:hypothetical protein
MAVKAQRTAKEFSSKEQGQSVNKRLCVVVLAVLWSLAAAGCSDPNNVKPGKPSASWPALSSSAQDNQVNNLLARLERSQDEGERVEIIAGSDSLWESHDPRVYNALLKRLSAEQTKEAMCVAWYLAKRGNAKALAILNQNNYKYPVSSYEWSYVIAVFGKQKYAPAVPALIDDMSAASLNVVGAAEESLRAFYPDSPSDKDFGTIEKAQSYFRKRYESEHQGQQQRPSSKQPSTTQSPRR